MKINVLTHYMHIFVDICLQQLGILVYAAVGGGFVQQSSTPWEMIFVATHLGMGVFSRYALGLSLKIPMNLQCYAAIGWGKVAKNGHWKKQLKGRMTIPQRQEDFETQLCCH